MRNVRIMALFVGVVLAVATAHAQSKVPPPAQPVVGTVVGLAPAQGELAFTVTASAIPELLQGAHQLVTCLNFPELNGKRNTVIQVMPDGTDSASGEAGSTALFGEGFTTGNNDRTSFTASLGRTYVALGAAVQKMFLRVRGGTAPLPPSVASITDQWCILNEVAMNGGTTSRLVVDDSPANGVVRQQLYANLIARYNRMKLHVFAVPRP